MRACLGKIYALHKRWTFSAHQSVKTRKLRKSKGRITFWVIDVFDLFLERWQLHHASLNAGQL